jgi:hypothetical protein
MTFVPPFSASKSRGDGHREGAVRTVEGTIQAVPVAPPVVAADETPAEKHARLLDWYLHPEKRVGEYTKWDANDRLAGHIRALEKDHNLPEATLPANPGAVQWNGQYHDPACGMMAEKPGGWPASVSPWGSHR